MKWTKEELLEQLKDPRELKSFSKRRPSGLTHSKLTKEVARRTQYKISAVSEVIDALVEIIKESIENKKSVKLKGLCTLYPIVSKARQGTCLAGGKGKEIMTIPPRWELKYMTNDGFANKMKKMEVTNEEVENLYKDPKK